MKRYCANCQKDFDFPIKSMKDLDNLICPECGSKIDKDSRNPAENVSAESEKTEEAIGRTLALFVNINYFFFITLSLVSVAAYFLKMDKLLYTMTAISLGVFLIQLFFRSLSFPTGILFLPIGAAAGYFIQKSIQGACLGIAIVFIIRHLIRGVIFRLIGKLISACSRA